MAHHQRDAVEQQRSRAALVLVLVSGLLLGGCATLPATAPAGRPFRFDQDTFVFANELVWAYEYDAAGHWRGTARVPRPDYTNRCFMVARSAKQFFLNARFAPGLPKAETSTYRRLIRCVVRRSPRRPSAPARQIVIPGYANLREFSQEQESLLKEECGQAWQSYFQWGHWRMIFPFSRAHQEQTARRIRAKAGAGRPVVLHLVRFPSLSINHAVIVFTALAGDHAFEFLAYDPNAPDGPATLTYDRASRTFSYPTNAYFPGGRVDIYDVYRSGCR